MESAASPAFKADRSTFEVIASPAGAATGFAKDKKYIYYEGYPLASRTGAFVPGIDPGSWQPFYNSDGNFAYYSRDKSAVYFTCFDCQFASSWTIPTADPATFSIAPNNPNFDAEDKNHKYLNGQVVQAEGMGTTTEIMAWSDPGTQIGSTTVTAFLSDSRYAKNKSNVYFTGILVAGADPSTFTPLFDPQGQTTFYAKDKKQVYFFSYQTGLADVIQGADPATFSVVASDSFQDSNAEEGAYFIWVGEDKNHVYDTTNVISGADPSSFVMLKDPRGEYTIYTKDAHNIFSLFSNAAIPGADYATFHATGRATAADKSHLYQYGQVVQ